MSLCRNLIVVAASTLLLVACAGQSQTYTMNSGQSVTMPKGTVTGAASVGDANALAQMITNSNANAMQQFDKLGGDMSQMQVQAYTVLLDDHGSVRSVSIDMSTGEVIADPSALSY